MAPSVHDLRRESTAVEVRHEAVDLAAFDLQDAHAVVGGFLGVRSTLRRLLESRPLLRGENVSKLGPHLAEGTTGARPELAQVFVTSEGIRDRYIAHLAVVGVNRDQCLVYDDGAGAARSDVEADEHTHAYASLPAVFASLRRFMISAS